jgi:hypothetical protein
LISSIIFPTNETTTAATSLEILPEKDKGKAQISFLVAYMTELFTYRMIMVIIIVLRKKKRKRKGEKSNKNYPSSGRTPPDPAEMGGAESIAGLDPSSDPWLEILGVLRS